MSRKFIGFVVSAALLVTAVGSRPVQADDDLAAALAALVGIAVVGSIIAHNLDDDDRPDIVRSSKTPKNKNTHDVSSKHRIYRDITPRPLPRGANRNLLPGRCLRSFDTRDGRLRVFEKRCLKRQYGFTRSLPRGCRVRFRSDDEQYRGYDARCLRRAGYKLARG